MIKAIFFDIDGTLVSFRSHTVPISTIETLKELKAKGIKLFVATGRPPLVIDNLDGIYFDGYITMNGSYCYTVDQQVIYKNCIHVEDIERMIDYSCQHKFPFAFVCNDHWFITRINKSVENLANLTGIPIPPIAPVEEARGKEIFQLIGYFADLHEDEIFGKILLNSEPMRWHSSFTDIISKGNSKSHGIDRVLEHYDIGLHETMAFGDGGNDIQMLKHCAISVAMGNADDNVKKAADFVTTSVDDDGIANALKHYGLIE